MPITILCPQCSAKYNLRKERVALGIKRALCYCCHAEFDIEGAVLELLGMAPDTGTTSAQLAAALPPTVAVELDAPSMADEQVAELAGIEQMASELPQPAEQIFDEKPIEEPAIQANDFESDQPPPLDIPRQIEDYPDSADDFAPTAQIDAPEATAAEDIAPLLIQNASEVASDMEEMRVEIESSDLIFDTEEALPAQVGDETNFIDAPDEDTGNQSDISVIPLEDGEELSASDTKDGDKTSDPIQSEVEPTEYDVLDGLPITIEIPDEPDEHSDAPIAALVQDAEVPSPQSEAQLSSSSDEEDAPLVPVSTFEEPETDIAAETKEPKFDVGDFLDATTPFADDEETTDAIPISLGEDDNGQAPEDTEVPATELQQEPSFTQELALAGDAALLSNIKIHEEPTPNISAPQSAETDDIAQPGIVPLAAPTGEGLSVLAGSGPSRIFDDFVENATPSETELPAKAAPQLEKVPEPQADEPALSATNETAKIKVRMGDDLIENLTIEEVTAMVEDRRLQENHYIARQFSENWIAAALVPALRPVFEKVRAEKVRFEVPPPPSPQGGKRGLFNGLFGRN
ncbi:MAG: hypothetical protein LBC63_10705 [Holophagales bacterium]|jgi:hypothetical protein|nr:hypothetical protein [Holophagales bacterium]